MKNKFEKYFTRSFIIGTTNKERVLLYYLEWIFKTQAQLATVYCPAMSFCAKILLERGFTDFEMGVFIKEKERVKEIITKEYVIFREEYIPQYIAYIDKLVELFTAIIEELEEIRKEEVVV